MRRRAVVGLLAIAVAFVSTASSPASTVRTRITLRAGDIFYVAFDRRNVECILIPVKPPSIGCVIVNHAADAVPGSYTVVLSDQNAVLTKISRTGKRTTVARFVQPLLASHPFASARSARPRRIFALGTNTEVIAGGSHVGCLRIKGVVGCSLLDSTGHAFPHTYEVVIGNYLAGVAEAGPPGAARTLVVRVQPR
jgi:hypothetical protein